MLNTFICIYIGFYGWLLSWPLRASTAALNCTLLATKVTHCFADVFNQRGSPILSDSDLFFFFNFGCEATYVTCSGSGRSPNPRTKGIPIRWIFLVWLFLQLCPLPLPLFFFLPYSWQNLWLNGLPLWQL